MSIDVELRVWDGEKADKRWLDWLELSSSERAESEPEEIVEGVLEIIGDPDADESWVTGRLAMLDLAFGQVGNSFPVANGRMVEVYAGILLTTFCGLVVEDGRMPSLGLFLHPTYYLRLLESVTDASVRATVDPKIADELLEFWHSVEPAFRAAIAADASRGNVVVIDTVNGETDNGLLAKRAETHAEWMRHDA